MYVLCLKIIMFNFKIIHFFVCKIIDNNIIWKPFKMDVVFLSDILMFVIGLTTVGNQAIELSICF